MFFAPSAEDPYKLSGANTNAGVAYTETAGKTQRAIPSGNPAVIITLGQSLVCHCAAGTFTPTNTSGVHMFNIFDGALYAGTNPVLGCSPSTVTNSPNLAIADGLITAGKFTNVIMTCIAVGGTYASDWAAGGKHNERIGVTVRRLAARGLTPTYILWHQGEADGPGGVSGSAYTASVKSVATTFRNLGVTCPFFVAKETMSSSTTNSTIQTAQANCVDGALNIVAGADWDSLDGTYRTDGTHPTQSGNVSFATLDVNMLVSYINSH